VTSASNTSASAIRRADDRDVVAGEAVGIAAAVPLFVVPVGDFLGQGEELQRHLDVLLGLLDGFAAQSGVRLHHHPFVGRERPGLQQDVVGNADLADVVQRRRAAQKVDVAVAEGGGKARMAAQSVGQALHIALGAQNVVAGFRIARLGEVGQGADADALGQVVLHHAPGHFGFEDGVLVLEPVAGALGYQLRRTRASTTAGLIGLVM
jgi:hypothetical protein